MDRRSFLKAAIAGAAAASLQKGHYTIAEEIEPEMESRDRKDSIFEIIHYHHEIMVGTSYEVGKMQGEFLKETGWGVFSYEPPESGKAFRETQQLYDEFCPGLNDEIQGIADGLGLPPEKVTFCAVVTHGCSHMTVLPSMTEGKHVYVARSYEFSPGDADLRLCTARVKGKAAHIGFSELLCGRNDGVNKYGLCVTMSGSWGGVPEESKMARGFHYAIGIRALLDNCRTTNEAVDFLQHIPIGSAVNIIVADKAGSAALVEIAGRKRATKTISSDTPEQYLISTNKYNLLDIPIQSQEAIQNTTIRYDAAERWLKANAGRISKEALRGFLTKEYPEGFCGDVTLWSMVFDASDGTVEIRFGPPPYNGWHFFTLDGPVGMREYMAVFPGKKT